MTICVYTCVTGDYHPDLQPHPDIPGVEWIAFSDTLTDHPDWEIRKIEPSGDPRRRAKYYKMCPGQVLPEYDWTIWIDGTVRVKSRAFVAEAFQWTHDGIAMFRHPERDNIWDEADVSLTMPKYHDEPIARQVECYAALGLPSGLWAAGIIARKASEQIGQLGKLWLGEVERWSVQDQLSLPYCLWKLGIEPGAFPQSLYSNRWLTVTGHNPDF